MEALFWKRPRSLICVILIFKKYWARMMFASSSTRSGFVAAMSIITKQGALAPLSSKSRWY